MIDETMCNDYQYVWLFKTCVTRAQSTHQCGYIFPIIFPKISKIIYLCHDVSRLVDILSLITYRIYKVCCLNELRNIGGRVALIVEFEE